MRRELKLLLIEMNLLRVEVESYTPKLVTA
jgi:hypothetical protein